MIEYLEGKIISIDKSFIVLDLKGIGIKIYHTNPLFFKLNNFYKIDVFIYVKEDDKDCYGFNNLEEKELFINLISVKGIGPKTSFNMIRNSGKDLIIEAIVYKDVDYLKKLNGIGIKLANQIILDIYDKYKNYKIIHNSIKKDVYDALVNLNINSKDINYVLENLNPNIINSDIALKEALKLLNK